jgi:hypothetical protein
VTDPEKQPPREEGDAHQPDGTDSSAEWQAQIADGNMIPKETPASG